MYSEGKIVGESFANATKTINFFFKILNLLTKEQQELYENAKICYNCRKKLKINIWKIKNIVKLDIIAIIQENMEVLGIGYEISNVAYLKKLYSFS